MASTLQIERDNGIATVTFNRPEKKNAINDKMWRELEQLLIELRSSDDRAIIFTGAGGAFCSGADVSEMGDGPHPLASMRRVGDIVLALQRLPQPTIAKVSGIAAGVGLNMALVCDLVVADTTARFSEIFARRGLSVDGGGSWILPRLIGMQRAKELILLADIIDAEAASSIGLLNRLVEPDELDATVDDLASRLASGPPIALAMSKRLLNNAFDVTLEQALDDEGLSQSVNFRTADTKEAVEAFMERREPKFSGR